MQATIGQAGAAGVALAISDAMQAAEYARRLKAATAENDSLRNTVEAMKSENRRLSRENRAHRFAKSRAYSNGIEMQIEGATLRSFRALKTMNTYLLGIVTGLVIAFIVAWCHGV